MKIFVSPRIVRAMLAIVLCLSEVDVLLDFQSYHIKLYTTKLGVFPHPAYPIYTKLNRSFKTEGRALVR